ncbi:MAG TPA: thiol:disulfide interchange protein DsbG [Gammaproteobacteria bacterium]|nr:thiol:disulfide interchange protein DsbG [Gammaproteobacteria bacterium]
MQSSLNRVRRQAASIVFSLLSCLAFTANAQNADQPLLQMHWPQLETADWIAEGAAKPLHVLYAFVDPNCPYCHQLWVNLQSQYQHGLQVRFILVGIISATSPTKAAAILESDNPLQAWQRNEREWNKSPGGSPGGGIAPLHQLDFSMRLRLTMNYRRARDFGIIGTPGLVWKDRTGTIHVLQSSPLPAQLAQIVRSASAD